MITNSHNRTIPIIKSATVLFNEKNEIVGAVETLKDISENINYKNELASIKRMYYIDDGFHGIIGRTPVMQGLYEHIESVASLDTPVIILGESGTGTEMFANALHATWDRASNPLNNADGYATSDNVLEMILLGLV